MYMDEFVKRLYDFMGIYKIFWSQNSHYRYLSIFYRFFIDIFSKIPAQARVLHSRNFSVEKSVFFDFSMKNRRFYRFFHNFFSDRFFHCFFFLVQAENRFFNDISIEKTDFFVPG